MRWIWRSDDKTREDNAKERKMKPGYSHYQLFTCLQYLLKISAKLFIDIFVSLNK